MNQNATQNSEKWTWNWLYFTDLMIYKDNFVRVQKILLQVKLKREDFVSVFLYNIHTWNANLYAKHLMGYYSAADARQYSSIHAEY